LTGHLLKRMKPQATEAEALVARRFMGLWGAEFA
jgi:hypothetical protein